MTSTLRLYALLWILFQAYFHGVMGAGIFQIKLISFRNFDGSTEDGKCCSGSRSVNKKCPPSCRTFFQVCLTHYQKDIPASPACRFGKFITPVVGNNSIEFVSVPQSKYRNPIELSFNMSWMDYFSLIIEAWHDRASARTGSGREKDLIYRMSAQRELPVSKTWNDYIVTTNNYRLSYSYRVICVKHYYGRSCTKHCIPRDDHWGHYNCATDGTRICRDGFKGEYCQDPECKAGCHKDHGYCDTVGECKCRNGWTGPLCNQCERDSRCKHGTCRHDQIQPFSCICDSGWGGMWCDIDLNYCTNHKPCKNNGTCYNRDSNFTCSCKKGFTGKRCETSINFCSARTCYNGGICRNVLGDFACKCQPMFYGKRCEIKGQPCINNHKCYNGGTCVRRRNLDKCICRPGFDGDSCQFNIDDCLAQPCLNGGTCFDGDNSFHCACPYGYTGHQCEMTNNPCHNGQCKNGAKCKPHGDGFQCICPKPFTGPVCDQILYSCDFKKCRNGGNCIVSSDGTSYCDCAPGYEGQYCENVTNNCLKIRCLNGGTCNNYINDYKCGCLHSYYGRRCQHRINGSAPSLEGSTEPSVEEDSGLSQAQLVIIVCCGVGLPILIIIVVIIIFIVVRKRKPRNDSNLDHERENRENECASMNNKLGGTANELKNVFMTTSSSDDPYKRNHGEYLTDGVNHLERSLRKPVKNTNLVNDLNIHNNRSSFKNYNHKLFSNHNSAANVSSDEQLDFRDTSWSSQTHRPPPVNRPQSQGHTSSSLHDPCMWSHWSDKQSHRHSLHSRPLATEV